MKKKCLASCVDDERFVLPGASSLGVWGAVDASRKETADRVAGYQTDL